MDMDCVNALGSAVVSADSQGNTSWCYRSNLHRLYLWSVIVANNGEGDG